MSWVNMAFSPCVFPGADTGRIQLGVVVARDTLPSCAPPLVLDRLGSPLPYEHEATNRVAATAAVTTSSLFRGFFMSSLSLRCLVG